MKPVEYKIYSIPDFPEDSMLQMVGRCFRSGLDGM